MKFNLKKKTLMLGGLAVLLVATAVTYALLSTKSQQNVNTFSGSGHVNIAVVENNSNGHKEDEVIGNAVEFDRITQTDIDKVVYIKNVYSDDYKTTDTYVKVKLVPQIVSDTDSSIVYGKSIKLKYTMHYVDDNTDGIWKYDESNDVFYYTKALKPNEISKPLLDKVALFENESIPKGYHLELNVLADGIAADPIENLTTAWKLKETAGNYFEELSDITNIMYSK